MSQKSLGKNAIFNVAYKCLNVVFPLITMIYVSRVLLPDGVGKVASAQNIIAYFVIIASLGLPAYGVKKIAECRDNREYCSKTFSELFVINVISTLLCSFIYIIMIFSVGFFYSKIVISMVVGIQLFANFINIDWLYQGFEEYKYIMMRSLTIKIISLIAVFAFIHTQDDYIIYALITTLSLVANFVFNAIHLPHFVSLCIQNLDIKRHIKPVLTLLAASIAIEIYTLADTTMLSVFKGDEIVGYYSNATKCVSIVRIMIAASCAVFLPRLNYYIGHNQLLEFNSLAKKGIKLLCAISIPAALGIAVLSDNFVYILFGDAYAQSVTSMQILSLSIITVAISNFTGYQILLSVGKEKILLYSTIIGALINILLNSVLILPYGHYGASIASVISEGTIALYQLYYVRKYISLNFISFPKTLGKILMPSLAMLTAIVVVKFIFQNVFIEMVISVLIGGLSFMLVGYIFRNEFVMLIVNKLNNK